MLFNNTNSYKSNNNTNLKSIETMKMDLISSSYNQDSDEKQALSGFTLNEPFHLLKETPVETQPNGSTNLILYNQKQEKFNEYCCKKVKEQLSSFISHFPGNIDGSPSDDIREHSTLASLFTKQQVAKEILPLTSTQLYGFRLQPGPFKLPPEYQKILQDNLMKNSEENYEKKSKKSKHSDDESQERKKKKKEKKKKKKSDKNEND